MGWNQIDDKHKKHTDKAFVSCEEVYEVAYLKTIIREEFPSFTDSAIDKAIQHCCATIPAPRPRQKFLNCLQHQLGGVW
jgi:hypothetical protein